MVKGPWYMDKALLQEALAMWVTARLGKPMTVADLQAEMAAMVSTELAEQYADGLLVSGVDGEEVVYANDGVDMSDYQDM